MPSPIPSPEELNDEKLEQLRQSNLGRLLDEVHVGFDRLALGYLRDAGYPNTKSAHTHVLRTMRIEGDSITHMAQKAGISKQAMSKLVASFEAEGLLEWRGIENSGMKLVHATERGRHMLAVGLQALRQAELDYFEALSEAEREKLRDLLKRAAAVASSDLDDERLSIWRRRRV